MSSRSKFVLAVIAICGLAVSLAAIVHFRNESELQKTLSVLPPALSSAPSAVSTSVPVVAQEQTFLPMGSASSPVALTEEAASATMIARSKDGVTEIRTYAATSGTRMILENPTLVSGTSTTFESRISWKVQDDRGTIVSQGGTSVHSPDAGQPGAFAIQIFYDVAPRVKTGTLMVYEASAKDGTPIHSVTVPVEFFYGQWKFGGCDQQSATLSFPKKTESEMNCDRVFPVSRLVCGDPTSNDLIAVHELLKGPTTKEKSAGYFTSIPDGVETPSTWWDQKGTLIFDFGPELEAGVAGSCRVTSIRAQFRETLKAQTGSVGDGPYISIQHRINDILQP